MANSPQLVSNKIEVPDSIEEVTEYYYRRGWTDGLPIVPPTEDRVEKMLTGTTRKAEDVIGEVAPTYDEATVEKIAINAVMAGCLPQYMPVIITAVEALIEKQFNLYAMQTTTHSATPLIIINGPIRKELGINSGYNVFGQGTMANATIGRAIRFIQLNIGGGIPGKVDRSTQGASCKYSFCIAENEEKSPWPPLHVDLGFDPSASTVTALMAENPHNINDHSSIDGPGILTTIVGTITTQGSNNLLYRSGEVLLALCPEHAATIAGSGFSKQDVKHLLYEKARLPRSVFSPRQQELRFPDLKPDDLISVAYEENAILVIVAGGAGKHSAFCPNFGFGKFVTKQIKP